LKPVASKLHVPLGKIASTEPQTQGEKRANTSAHNLRRAGHYYSVPHAAVRTTVELRVTANLVECFSSNQHVACHPLSQQRGRHTTTPEHMPASHRAHLEWTPQKLIDRGLRIGVSTAAVVTWQLEHRPHPEQGYRACLGMQRLARERHLVSQRG
jgi:hypothetical protein